MPKFSFVKNNFQIRSGTKIYDKKTSSSVGLAREKIKDANSRDAFMDANLLVGDFIMQVFPDKNLETDYMFDDFLAAAKISKAFDVNSPNFSPFLAIVNIPEITHISTPESNDSTPEYNRKIRDIVGTLGVFKLYNYTGNEFAVPNYGDPVQVTFKDMDTFSDPIFIRPMITGQVNFAGSPGQSSAPSSYYDTCGSKPALKTKIPLDKIAKEAAAAGDDEFAAVVAETSELLAESAELDAEISKLKPIDLGLSETGSEAVQNIENSTQDKAAKIIKLEEEIVNVESTINAYSEQASAIEANYGGVPPGIYETDYLVYLGLQESLDKTISKRDIIKNKLDSLKNQQEQEAEKKQSKTGPSKPSQQKEDKNTPNTASPPQPTQTACRPPGNFDVNSGPYPDDLKWVKMSNFGPRVWQIKGTAYHGWGTVKMQRYLKGLNNVRGGEDLGRGYTNPIGKNASSTMKSRLALPPDIKPGWWFGDVSRGRSGGDTWNRHLTHQSGIGVDISIPTKNVVNGRVFRGMNLRINPILEKKGKSSANSPKFWGMKGTPTLTREYIDEVALMDYLRYSIPLCERILFGKDQLKYAIELMEKWAREGINGWSLTSKHYLEAQWAARKWPAGQKPKETCRLYGDDPVHNNHFHIRLRGPGIAPGPFTKHGRQRYPADQKPGMDKRGGRYGTRGTTKDQGNGQVDPGQPGYTQPKSTYKKD
tara:strand:- start:15131 stop:17251 length:2121 start_codon:yes stop_codon:yes gene_type:complete